MTFFAQVYSRALASGSDRAGIFAWAVVNMMYRGGGSDVDARDHSAPAIADTIPSDAELQHVLFQHDVDLRASMRLFADVLFLDMYPRDCAAIDWEITNICSSSSSSSSRSSSSAQSANAVCLALLAAMDTAAWTHGAVLTSGGQSSPALNFDHTSWVKSTSYRCVVIFLPRARLELNARSLALMRTRLCAL